MYWLQNSISKWKLVPARWRPIVEPQFFVPNCWQGIADAQGSRLGALPPPARCERRAGGVAACVAPLVCGSLAGHGQTARQREHRHPDRCPGLGQEHLLRPDPATHVPESFGDRYRLIYIVLKTTMPSFSGYKSFSNKRPEFSNSLQSSSSETIAKLRSQFFW